MEQCVLCHLPIVECRLHHLSCLFEVRMPCNVVSDDLPVEQIHHRGKIDLSDASEVEFRHIGHEHLVGHIHIKLPVKPVVGNLSDRTLVGTVSLVPFRRLEPESELLHDPVDGLVVYVVAF